MKTEKRSGAYRIQPMRNGKRYSFTFDHKPTKADIENAISEAISKESARNGIDMTLKTAAEKYISSKENVLSPATIKGYDKILRNMPEWILSLKIDLISQDDLNRFVNELSINKSPKTVRNYHGFVSAVLGVYRPSFSISTHLPQNVRKEAYIPSDEDIKALLSEMKGSRYYVPVILMAYGLRRSEVLAITSDDVENDCIHITKALVKDKNNEWVIKTTKTTESTRDIFVPKEVTEYIQEKGYAFHGHVSAIYRELEAAQDRLNIPHFSPHKMRHYFASKMHELGIPDADVMALGGWKTDNVMKTVYRHSLEKEKKNRSASDKLRSALFD